MARAGIVQTLEKRAVQVVAARLITAEVGSIVRPQVALQLLVKVLLVGQVTQTVALLI
jgi:hypothetical protein